MIGLIVLALAGIYAWLIVLITRWAMRRASVPWKRTAIKFGLPAALCIAPVADGIYGYLMLQYLCATEAKTEVFNPIKIPAEYFNSDGTRKFSTRNGTDVNWGALQSVVRVHDRKTLNYRAPNLQRSISELTDSAGGQVYARQVFFYFRGGWLRIAEWKTWSDSCIPQDVFTGLVLRGQPDLGRERQRRLEVRS